MVTFKGAFYRKRFDYYTHILGPTPEQFGEIYVMYLAIKQLNPLEDIVLAYIQNNHKEKW